MSKGIITLPTLTFLIKFAEAAYSVNWGHTGAVDAIPELINVERLDLINDNMSAFLNNSILKKNKNNMVF